MGRARLLGGPALVLLLLAAEGPVPAAAAVAAPPFIVLRPSCGPPGPGRPAPTPTPTLAPSPSPPVALPTYTIQVIGRGLPPGGGELVFNPGPTEETFRVNIDSAGGLDVVIRPVAVPNGTYTVALVSFHLESVVARAIFLVPCPPTPRPVVSPVRPTVSPGGRVPPVLDPAITLTPAVGPPGTITTVRGVQFPAGVPVQLAWSQGIVTTAPSAIVTDGAGTFTATVLVFPHDALGARVLTAASVPPPDTTLMGFASATFLVVPGATQPRDFSWRR